MSPECLHWTPTFLKELLINFILVYFLVSSYVALFYISKGVRKNVSIISERSSKRCKENRSITLCQKEQSESTVINANFSKSAPSSKKNNNTKPFKKYIRLVFNEIQRKKDILLSFVTRVLIRLFISRIRLEVCILFYWWVDVTHLIKQ